MNRYTFCNFTNTVDNPICFDIDGNEIVPEEQSKSEKKKLVDKRGQNQMKPLHAIEIYFDGYSTLDRKLLAGMSITQ